MPLNVLIGSRVLRRTVVAAGACVALSGVGGGSAFAAGGAVGCDGVTVSVAPGGEVRFPVNCVKAAGYDPPGFVVRRDVRGLPAVSAGTVLDGVTVLDGARIPIKGVSDRLVFRAAAGLMANSEVLVGGVMVNTVLSSEVAMTESQNAKIIVAVDTTGANAPLCRDVGVSVQAGGTVDVPLSCVGPDPKANPGKQLVYEVVGGPTKGAVLSIDQGSGVAKYAAGVNESGQDQVRYRAKTQDGTQVSNTVAVTVDITAKGGSPPENKPPVCESKEQRIRLDYVTKKGKFEGKDTTSSYYDFATPHQLQLTCRDPEGQPLRFELLSSLKESKLDGFDAASGAVMWHPAEMKMTNDGDLVAPWKEYPDELKLDSSFRTRTISTTPPKGFDENFTYRAIDPQGAISNTATFLVKERTIGCALVVRRTIEINGKKVETWFDLCENGKDPSGMTPESQDDRRKDTPFADEGAPVAACIKPFAFNGVAQTVSRRVKVNGRQVEIKAPGLVVRSTKNGKVLFTAKASGRGDIFPQVKLKKSGKSDLTAHGKQLVATLDGYSLLTATEKNYTEMWRSKMPVSLRLAARQLKPGMHTFRLVVRRYKGEWSKPASERVVAKVRFRVMDCDPSRLVVAKIRSAGRAATSVKVTGGSAVAQRVTFRLPARSGAVKLVRVGRVTLALKKNQRSVSRAGFQVKRRGVVLEVTGARIPVSAVAVVLAGRPKKGVYRTVVAGKEFQLKLSTAVKRRR